MIWLRHLPTMTWHHEISDDTMVWHNIISYDTISYYILKHDFKLNVVLHISFLCTLLPTFLPSAIFNLLTLITFGNVFHFLHNIYFYNNWRLFNFQMSAVTGSSGFQELVVDCNALDPNYNGTWHCSKVTVSFTFLSLEFYALLHSLNSSSPSFKICFNYSN